MIWEVMSDWDDPVFWDLVAVSPAILDLVEATLGASLNVEPDLLDPAKALVTAEVMDGVREEITEEVRDGTEPEDEDWDTPVDPEEKRVEDIAGAEEDEEEKRELEIAGAEKEEEEILEFELEEPPRLIEPKA